jgi:Bacterial regulatory proteins, lacI family
VAKRVGVSEATVSRVLNTASAPGLTPVLCTQTKGGVSEADYVELPQQQLSGVVFAGGLYAQADAPHDHYRLLAERNIPVVLVNAAIEHLGFPACPATTPSPSSRPGGTWPFWATNASGWSSAPATTCPRRASRPPPARSPATCPRSSSPGRSSPARAATAPPPG